jgi:hypothetical protein
MTTAVAISAMIANRGARSTGTLVAALGVSTKEES